VTVVVDIQSASVEPAPDEEDIRRWATTTLEHHSPSANVELTIRLVDIEEMTQLNHTFRGKSAATNVLSFPVDLPQEIDKEFAHPLLGDIIICAPVVRSEALQQGKTEEAHWAHMVVHGTLHLVGFDHIEEEEAKTMEALESAILGQLNYGCPYTVSHMKSARKNSGINNADGDSSETLS